MQGALEAMSVTLAEHETSIRQLQLRSDRQTNRIVSLVKQLGELQRQVAALRG